MMIWWLAGLVILLIVLWWLLIRTEGVYLGRRVVIALYDLYAKRYDAIVQQNDVDEHLYLAVPLIQRLDDAVQPLILDVGTGTGRLPLALCQHARFEGRIIALDASRGMLQQAVEKIERNHFGSYVHFLQGNGLQLPFPDGTFTVVTCLEALEFMPEPKIGLHELVRVLADGGLLLTTRRIREPLMPFRLWSRETMHDLLNEMGMDQVEFEIWQYDYEKVWCVKASS